VGIGFLTFVMMSLDFYKYHAVGNDFVLIDNTCGHFSNQSPSSIQELCHRHFGIGADGLILLEPSSVADFKMVYFNADGNLGSMCGNGGRCAVHLAHRLGLVSDHGVFDGPDGVHQFEINDTQISISMGQVSEIKHLDQGLYLDTGSPHLICFRDAIEHLEVGILGRELRDQFGRAGVNVNYVCQKDGQFSMRTYERGVEAETLSCGTGATAAAIAIMESEKSLKESIDLNTLGGTLTVSAQRDGSVYRNVWLSGPVVFVYKGKLQ